MQGRGPCGGEGGAGGQKAHSILDRSLSLGPQLSSSPTSNPPLPRPPWPLPALPHPPPLV